MKTGQTLASRYVLVHHEGAVGDGVERWSAHDTRLDADVTVLAFSGELAADAHERATAARVVRDGRLTRITDVFDRNDSTLVVLARPAGVRLLDLSTRKLLPLDAARAAVRAAADALSAASGRGLGAPGALLDLVVTATGKVVVAGAGLGDALPAPAQAPGTALALFLRDATSLAGEPPEQITAGERGLIADAAGGVAVSLASVLDRVPAPSGTPLAGFKRASTLLPTRVALVQAAADAALAAELAMAEAEAAQAAAEAEEAAAAALALAIEEAEARGVDVADVLADVAPELVPDVDHDEDRWEFDALVEEHLAEVEPTPSLTDATLDFLHRRYPESEIVARLLERRQTRQEPRHRINATPWVFLAVTAFVGVMGYLGYQWTIAPFETDIDLRNNPPQNYPSFTFPPSDSPSPDAP